MSNIVESKSLDIGYKRKLVVRDLAVTIKPGVTALLGPNGAGKSTLLRAIATEKSISGGSLSVLGHSVNDSDGRTAVRARTSFLSQNPGYQRGFSVIEHLQYCSWLKGVQVVDQRIAETLELMGLVSTAHQKLRTLSGGQLRRAMLGGALITSPALLILDEPTASLDPLQRQVFKKTLADLPKGVSVIFSTHLLDEIKDVADSVAVMHLGMLKFIGAPRDIVGDLANPSDDGTDFYARLVE